MENKVMAKLILISSGSIFALVGLIVMVLGILLMGDPDSHDPDQSFIPAVGYLVDLIENTKESVREKAHTHLLGLVESSASWMVGLGATFILLGVLSVIGAIKHNMLLLYVYIGVIAVVSIFQMVISIYVAANKGQMEDDLNNFMKVSLQEDYEGLYINFNTFEIKLPDDPASQAWDDLQAKLECCGADSAADIVDSDAFGEMFTFLLTSTSATPPVCCKVVVEHYPERINELISIPNMLQIQQCMTSTNSDLSYSRGCYGIMEEAMIINFTVPLVLLGLVVGMEVGAILCAYWLTKKDQQKNQVM